MCGDGDRYIEDTIKDLLGIGCIFDGAQIMEIRSRCVFTLVFLIGASDLWHDSLWYRGLRNDLSYGR